MVDCNSQQVQVARDYVKQYLTDNGLPIDPGQIDTLVTKCCADIKSKGCIEALAAIIAAKVCDAYTSGSCPQCCAFAANIVAPYVVGAAAAIGSFFKDGWEIFASIFGSKQCDYDPGYNAIKAEYVKALNAMADSYSRAWNDTFFQLGIQKPSWAKPGHLPVRRWPGYELLQFCTYEQAEQAAAKKPLPAPFTGFKQVRPVDLIIYNRYINGARNVRKNTIVDHGSNGFMVLYGISIDPLSSPEDMFRITWKHWTCSEKWSNTFQTSVETMLKNRWNWIAKSGPRYNEWLSGAIAETIKSKNLQSTPRFKLRFKAIQNKPTSQSNTATLTRPAVLTEAYVESRVDELNSDIFDAIDAGTITEACIDMPGYDAFRDSWDDTLDTARETDMPIPVDVLSNFDLGVDHYRTALNVCKGTAPGEQPPIAIKPPGPALISAMMPASEARAILLSVWKKTTGEVATLPELQIAQAIGRFEGRWGSSRAKNNWGGVQCTTLPPCPSGCFEYTDSHADGSKYQGCLRVYPTQEDGAADMVRLLTTKRPAVWSAMKQGDAGKVASKMRATGYHETASSKYQAAIYGNAAQIAKELGEPLKVKKGTTGAASEASGRGVLLIMAVLGALALKGKR